MGDNFVEMAEAFQAELAEAQRQNKENLDRLDALMDRGWRSIFGAFDDREGPTLDQIKEASKRNREMSLNPHVGGGLELINSYVWADGVNYELGDAPAGTRGRPSAAATGAKAVREAMQDPVNQENYFGSLARKERQAAAYYDGIILYYGIEEEGKKRLYQVSIQNITDDYRNPDNDDEIWAYRRTWNRWQPGASTPTEMNEWIFVDQFYDKIGRRRTLLYNNERERIAVEKRMFVKKVNPIPGWAYGTADVQRGLSWAEDYRIAMYDGKRMNTSMASVWATAKANSEAGAKDASVKQGRMPAGATAHTSSIYSVLPSAGNAYDFQKLLPILAMFAAGIGVSVVALSMNSGNAGGSYGAAKSLERPEQLSTKTRRSYNGELDRDVLVWLGADKDVLDVWFPPIQDATELYRADQRIALRLGTGLYEGEEIKRKFAEVEGSDPERVTKVPEGWLIPNNENSIELRTIDPNTSGSQSASGNPANGGNFTPTQGSGQGQGQGDQRSDDIRTNRESLIEHLTMELEISREEAEVIVDGLTHE